MLSNNESFDDRNVSDSDSSCFLQLMNYYAESSMGIIFSTTESRDMISDLSEEETIQIGDDTEIFRKYEGEEPRLVNHKLNSYKDDPNEEKLFKPRKKNLIEKYFQSKNFDCDLSAANPPSIPEALVIEEDTCSSEMYKALEKKRYKRDEEPEEKRKIRGSNNGKRKRKYKADIIRKKIKAMFHKSLKRAFNRKLECAGSRMFFGFLPQSWVCDISRNKNSPIFKLTFREILKKEFSKDIDEKKYKKKKLTDQRNEEKNTKLLKYLDEHPGISERSKFNKYGNTKYVDILKEYFDSEDFEKSIEVLSRKGENEDYIKKYILVAENYISFFQEGE